MLLNTLSFILKSRQLTIKELSRQTGIGYESLIKLVNNPKKLPNAESLKLLCETLQTTPQTIIFYAGIGSCNKKEFSKLNSSEQKFVMDCSRFFVVLLGKYFTSPEDLLLKFDRAVYKSITDDNGRKYYELENLFNIIEYLEGLYYLSLNINDELVSQHDAKYGSYT